LVAQDEDFQLLGGVAMGEQREELDRAAPRQVDESGQHSGRPLRWINDTSWYDPRRPNPQANHQI
jgi:hypothetical protein